MHRTTVKPKLIERLDINIFRFVLQQHLRAGESSVTRSERDEKDFLTNEEVHTGEKEASVDYRTIPVVYVILHRRQ